jgi:5-methylcytosine-specific restriction protein A
VLVSIVATLDQIVAALGEHSHARAGLATDLGPGGGPLDPTTLSRLLCEALISPTLLDGHGAVLAHGRATRLATPAQRRAVFARDRGCVIPGCTAPPHWCDIHHVTPWTEGGLTDVDAMVAVCGQHHTALHAGIWTLTMINGVPYAIPPAWLDPTRAPRRNTLHDDEATARHLAHQLTLDLDGRRLGNPRAGLSPGTSTDEESPP